VLAITDDHVLAAALRRAGADVVPDAVTDDLNGTLLQAALEARRRWPDLATAAVCADLPSLRAEDLTRALVAAATHAASFVADVNGDGTTMVAALSPEDFAPRFGPGSRDAHLAEGAHEIVEVDVPTLRRDVDTPDDLRDALRLGVGERTAGAVAGLRL
jgi:2-phospho-L-lactate guanylyltransferase